MVQYDVCQCLKMVKMGPKQVSYSVKYNKVVVCDENV
jgi:hypothetical protein